MTNTSLRMIAELVRNGLSLEQIEEMSEAEMIGWFVCFGEAQGGKWDWSRMRWKENA